MKFNHINTFKHGDKVIIVYINKGREEGVISIDERMKRVFLCTNNRELNGLNPPNLLGYKFGYCLAFSDGIFKAPRNVIGIINLDGTADDYNRMCFKMYEVKEGANN